MTYPSSLPALVDDIAVDVAVVGGGIAGVSVAWELAATGRLVALLEADRVGSGTTGRSIGQVSLLRDGRLSALLARLGLWGASRWKHGQLLAMEHLLCVVERLHIDCALECRPAYLVLEDAADIGRLLREVDAARMVGLDLDHASPEELPYPAASAVRLNGQLAFDPVKYVEGLAADVIRQGGGVFENTRVTRLSEGSPHRLVTAGGLRVRATHVVDATNAAAFEPSLQARLAPSTEIVLASPMPAGMARRRGVYAEVGSRPKILATSTESGRPSLFLRGLSGIEAGRRADLVGWAQTRLRVPRWERTRVASGFDTPDGVPFIGPLHPFAERAWVVAGLGAWGLASGVLAGIVLRDLIEGRESEHAEIYHPRRLVPVAEVGPPPAWARVQAQRTEETA